MTISRLAGCSGSAWRAQEFNSNVRAPEPAALIQVKRAPERRLRARRNLINTGAGVGRYPNGFGPNSGAQSGARPGRRLFGLLDCAWPAACCNQGLARVHTPPPTLSMARALPAGGPTISSLLVGPLIGQRALAWHRAKKRAITVSHLGDVQLFGPKIDSVRASRHTYLRGRPAVGE